LKLQIQPIQIRPLQNSRLNFWPTIRLRRTNKNFVDAVCASNLPQGKGNQSIFIKMLFNLNATALRLDAVTSSSFVLRPGSTGSTSDKEARNFHYSPNFEVCQSTVGEKQDLG